MSIINNIVTNTYDIHGNMMQAMVHQYLVTFEPEIDTVNAILRKNKLLGATRESKNINKKLLMQPFGHFEFDNHCLYSLGMRRGSDGARFEIKGLSDTHKVFFQWKDSFHLNELEIPLAQQASLLNIFNRKRIRRAGFTRVGKGWFHSNKAEREGFRGDGGDFANCSVLMGFECAIQVNKHQTGEQSAVFKADLAHKLVSKQTVHEMIFGWARDQNEDLMKPTENFKKYVESRLCGKYFVMRYNSRSMLIGHIDWAQNENSTFELKTGGKISYAEYLLQTYNIRSPNKEICVIKDFPGSCYLPQHMKLTMRSDECGDYDQVLEAVNENIQERLEKVHRFITHLGKSGKDLELLEANKKGGNTKKGNENQNINSDKKGKIYPKDIAKSPKRG